MPTGVGKVVGDMTTEVYHTLKFGGGACNVGDETGFAPSVQVNDETSDFVTDSFEQDQSVLARCE